MPIDCAGVTRRQLLLGLGVGLFGGGGLVGYETLEAVAA